MLGLEGGRADAHAAPEEVHAALEGGGDAPANHVQLKQVTCYAESFQALLAG